MHNFFATLRFTFKAAGALCIVPYALCILLFFSSCKADTPDGILSSDEMEAVLYDYHLAQKLGEKPEAETITHETDWNYNSHYYLKSALAKHHLTQADFDRSLEWYTRHSDLLFDIYKQLEARISAEAGNGGGSMARGDNTTQSGDTISIWRGAQVFLLSSTGDKHFSFEQPADTSLRADDRVLMRFNTAWAYREGSKQAAVQLALVYTNDSVDVRTLSVYNTGIQELSLRVGKARLKSVRGFIYQQTSWSEKPKLMVVTDFEVLRIRDNVHSSSPVPIAPADTTRVASPINAEQLLRDSLLRADSLKKAAPHFK